MISYKKKMFKYPNKYNDDELDRQIAIVNNEICDKKGEVKTHIDTLLREIQRNDNTHNDLIRLEEQL